MKKKAVKLLPSQPTIHNHVLYKLYKLKLMLPRVWRGYTLKLNTYENLLKTEIFREIERKKWM